VGGGAFSACRACRSTRTSLGWARLDRACSWGARAARGPACARNRRSGTRRSAPCVGGDAAAAASSDQGVVAGLAPLTPHRALVPPQEPGCVRPTSISVAGAGPDAARLWLRWRPRCSGGAQHDGCARASGTRAVPVGTQSIAPAATVPVEVGVLGARGLRWSAVAARVSGPSSNLAAVAVLAVVPVRTPTEDSGAAGGASSGGGCRVVAVLSGRKLARAYAPRAPGGLPPAGRQDDRVVPALAAALARAAQTPAVRVEAAFWQASGADRATCLPLARPGDRGDARRVTQGVVPGDGDPALLQSWPLAARRRCRRCLLAALCLALVVSWVGPRRSWSMSRHGRADPWWLHALDSVVCTVCWFPTLTPLVLAVGGARLRRPRRGDGASFAARPDDGCATRYSRLLALSAIGAAIAASISAFNLGQVDHPCRPRGTRPATESIGPSVTRLARAPARLDAVRSSWAAAGRWSSTSRQRSMAWSERRVDAAVLVWAVRRSGSSSTIAPVDPCAPRVRRNSRCFDARIIRSRRAHVVASWIDRGHLSALAAGAASQCLMHALGVSSLECLSSAHSAPPRRPTPTRSRAA